MKRGAITDEFCHPITKTGVMLILLMYSIKLNEKKNW